MPTNRKVIDFKIHNLTEEQFQELKEAGQIDPNAIYCTPDETVINFEEVNARIDAVDEEIEALKDKGEEINTEIEALKDKGGFPLLTAMWADHTLNDISWLNADTFSWQSGDVYVAAFEHLVNDYISLSAKGVLYAWTNTAGDETYYTKTSTPSVGDQLFDETGTPAIVSNSYVNGEISVVFIYADGSITYARTDPNAMLGRDTSKDVTLSAPQSETETISGITIRYYKADDGHKICMQDQEANVQALYEATGVAWYYIINMISKQFKLPRTKFGFTGLRDSVGGYVKAGLPNITGTFYGQQAALTSGSGAFFTGNNPYGGTVSSGSTNNEMRFDASRSSSVYGNSNTVQPKATQMYLYFYVGNFERDALEQTAGITSEQLNGKADVTRVVALEERDYVVASQEPSSANGYTWYRKYKSGWCEQGGTKTTNIKTITLPIVMKNNGYQGQVTGGDNNYGINYIMRNLTTTSCVVTARTSGGQDFDNWYGYWRVSGYAA